MFDIGKKETGPKLFKITAAQIAERIVRSIEMGETAKSSVKALIATDGLTGHQKAQLDRRMASLVTHERSMLDLLKFLDRETGNWRLSHVDLSDLLNLTACVDIEACARMPLSRKDAGRLGHIAGDVVIQDV